jgi:hypothetical protein
VAGADHRQADTGVKLLASETSCQE